MRLVNNLLIQVVSFPIHRAAIKLLYPFHVTKFGLANCLKFRFFNVLARWLFSTEASAAHMTFKDVDQSWEGKVPHYMDYVLFKGHRYKHIIAYRLRPATGFEDLQGLIVERADFALEQLQLSQIFDDTALYPPLDDFKTIPTAAQFYATVAIALSSMRI